jgi:hypothetical protein
MNIAIPDRYLLAADFEKRVINCIFPAGVWNVAAALAEVSEAASPFELEQLTGMDCEQVQEALKRLLARKLVRQDLMSWKEFTAEGERIRSAAKTTEGSMPHGVVANTPMAAPPPDKPAQAQAAGPAESTARIGNLPAKEGVAARLGTISRQQTAAGTTNAWVLQKPNPAQVAASKAMSPQSPPNGEQANGHLLRPMLAQIEKLKGGGVEGQLLVYQVFLRVPYELLHDEGIKSLHFVDERTVIQNPALHAAIVKAAKDVTGVDLA